MNITINNIKFNNYNKIQQKQTQRQNAKNTSQPCLAIFYAYPLFKGKTIPKLYEEYNWYINADRIPAVKSFLKIDASKDTMDKFLAEILKTKDRSIEFFDSIAFLAREKNELYKQLQEKVGPNSENIQIFAPDSLYNQSYKNYLETKYNNEKCIISLLKIRPDWSGDMLLKKYQNLYNKDDFHIGNASIKEFPNNHLKQIVEYLRNEMEYGVKNKKKISDLTIDNRKYEFAFFTEGKSDKNVFGVFTPEGKKFVLKMGTPGTQSLDEPFALGTLAKIDMYLTAHRCRNSAPLCYYNHKENFSVYKYIEHVDLPARPRDISTITSHLKDFKALGFTYNDNVGDKNFFMLTPNSTDKINETMGFEEGVANGEWISVDNDHVTFNSILQPVISGYCKYLPNGMGQMFM